MGHVIALLVAAGTAVGGWVFFFATDSQVNRVQALLVPAIAFLAVCVALGQWHIARNKLKLDLFKQRSEVYEATRKAIHLMIRQHTLTASEQKEFLLDTRGANWLFNAGVRNYVDDVWVLVAEMESLSSTINHAHRLTGHAAVFSDPSSHQQAQEDLNKARKRRTEILTWCNDQITNRRVEALFREFLEIEH